MVNGGEQFFFYHRYTHKLAPNIYIKKNIKKNTQHTQGQINTPSTFDMSPYKTKW